MQLTVPLNKRCQIFLEGIVESKTKVVPIWSWENKGVMEFKVTDDGLVGYGYPTGVGNFTLTITLEGTKLEPLTVDITVEDIPQEVLSVTVNGEVID